MATTIAGLVGTAGLIGFGSSASNISALGGALDLSGALIGFPILDFAFSVPRAGTISSIAAFFSTTVALSLLTSSISIEAQLYISPASSGPNNSFTPLAGASVVLPPISGIIAVGTTRNNIATGLAIPVSPQDRLVMVFTVTGTGITVVTTATGYASAGITIT